MKQYQALIAAVILAALTSPALAEFDYPGRVYSSKYKPGDCITPTDQAHAFYGHYARVEGVLDSQGGLGAWRLCAVVSRLSISNEPVRDRYRGKISKSFR